MPSRILPSNPSLKHLKHQAKDLQKNLKARHAEALARVREFHPKFAKKTDEEIYAADLRLAETQLVIAREYGFESWMNLKRAVESLAPPTASAAPTDQIIVAAEPTRDGSGHYEALAEDFVTAWESGDPPALQRLNQYYHRSFTWEDLRAEIWRQVYKVRQAKAQPGSFGVADAQWLMARDAGFGNWNAFLDSARTGAPAPGDPYAIDPEEDRITPSRNLSERDWDILIGVMEERRISSLDANGQMTDAALKRIASMEHVTDLRLGGSRQLTDAGLLQLESAPQLERLDLSEYPGGRITDRGLAVLRRLPALKTFQMSWQSAVSDAGVAHLEACNELESVKLMGTPTGDGAIRALVSKRKLRNFETGRLVTDAGLQLLHQFTNFKSWRGPGLNSQTMPPGYKPSQLLLDGPFTDQGLSSLAGLDGLFGLTFFWHTSAMTSGGLKNLEALPNLASFGCDGKLLDDTAMRYIASIPRLRKLMAQGAVASDVGFESLSRSQTIESIWGRECPNFTGRGFAAFSRMPALRTLGISCKNVDGQSLSLLPRFPALRDLTSIGITDSGFRHIGRCEKLENLSCMYCRDTTDVATEHIKGLSKLKSYYAGLTQITDRSLQILGGMNSLERVELYECSRVTDAGLVFLARLPKLRLLEVFGSPNITLGGTKILPKQIRVKFSV